MSLKFALTVKRTEAAEAFTLAEHRLLSSIADSAENKTPLGSNIWQSRHRAYERLRAIDRMLEIFDEN